MPMSEPTLEQKVEAIKKTLKAMTEDYKHASRQIGRKSWKSVADNLYGQSESLNDLLNNKGFLYGLLCDTEKQEQPNEHTNHNP